MVGVIAARVPESKLSTFHRVMAWVGTAGPADFTENELGYLFASGFLRECGVCADNDKPFEDKEDLF